jgi:hypothetical protein
MPIIKAIYNYKGRPIISVLHQSSMMYGRLAVHSHISLTSALVGGEWSDSGPGHFTPWIGAGWAPESACLNQD